MNLTASCYYALRLFALEFLSQTLLWCNFLSTFTFSSQPIRSFVQIDSNRVDWFNTKEPLPFHSTCKFLSYSLRVELVDRDHSMINGDLLKLLFFPALCLLWKIGLAVIFWLIVVVGGLLYCSKGCSRMTFDRELSCWWGRISIFKNLNHLLLRQLPNQFSAHSISQ